MIKYLFTKIPLALSMLCVSMAYADIYVFKDESGVQHLSNIRQNGAKSVMRTPSFVNSTQPENVQEVVNKPRFTTTVTANANANFFRGKYPRPVAVTLSGFGLSPYSQLSATQSIPFRINQENRALYAPYINAIAAQNRLDPALIHAVISAESAFNPNARSPAGAMGLMQLIPSTARRFGVEDAFDPIQNIQGGAAYLRFLLDRFDNIHLAVAGYNAGEGAVEKYNRTIPPYKETEAYVPRVLAFYQKYKAESGQ